MDKFDCTTERFSARSIGLVVLALGIGLAILGFLILPVVGLFFAIPLLILAAILLAAPQSKACRLITKKINN